MQSSCIFLRVGQEAATGRDGARSATAAGGDSSVVPVGNHGDNVPTTDSLTSMPLAGELVLDVLVELTREGFIQETWTAATWYSLIVTEGLRRNAF